MAVWFGQIAPVTGTTVTVTDIPFEPVAVVFFGVHNALTNISQSFGAASGSGEQWAMWTGIRQQTSGYFERRRELRNDCAINIYSLTNHSTLQSRGALSAFTSDGFSVAFTGAGGTNQPVFYMALGGQNISAAHAGTFTTTASTTGTVSVTAPGFMPKALIVGHVLEVTVNTQTFPSVWALGFTDGTNQFSTCAVPSYGTAAAGHHIQRTDSVACGYNGAETYLVELDSFDANGFTVNVTDSYSVNVPHGYLAIEAAAAVVGTSEFPDSTGVVSYATPGMEPGGVLFSWNGADTPSSSGSATMPVRMGVGGMDGVTDAPTKLPHGSISGLHRNNAPFGSYQPLQAWQENAAAHIIGAGSQVDPDATTIFHLGGFNLFEQGSFELDWTTATTNTREFGWLALPGALKVNWIPQIYRRLFVGGSSTTGRASLGFLELEEGGRIMLEEGDGFLEL